MASIGHVPLPLINADAFSNAVRAGQADQAVSVVRHVRRAKGRL